MRRLWHCRTYAVLTFLVLNLIPVGAVAIEDTVTVSGRVCDGSGEGTPTITSPTGGTQFDYSIVTVTGTAEPGQTVSILRNGAGAGSTVSVSSGGQSGGWSLPVTLVPGNNSLVARTCGSSTPVVVELGVSYQTPTDPFLIEAPYGTIDSTAGSDVRWRLKLNGGTKPYKLSTDWGDRVVDQQTVNGTDASVRHTYNNPGRHVALVRATDQTGRQSVMSFAVTTRAGPAGITLPQPSALTLLMFLSLEVLALILSFIIWEFFHQRHVRAERDCPQPGVGS